MSAEWIKVTTDLCDKPEVIELSGILKIPQEHVVGCLIRVWTWFDQHTENGNARGVTFLTLDRFTCVSGFAQAMAHVGWLVESGHSLILPNFDRHNGKSSKKRALTNERVKRIRNAVSVTKALPEKKRKEKIYNPLNPPEGEHIDQSMFDRFWEAYPRKIGKQAARTAWKRHVNGNADAVILSVTEHASRSPTWRSGFIPNPATYLNQHRWEDELPPPINFEDL